MSQNDSIDTDEPAQRSVRAVLIPSDRAQPMQLLTVDPDGGFEALVGGFIGSVDLPAAAAMLHINDESQVLRLPYNVRSTLLWRLIVPHAENGPRLTGPALLVGLPDARAPRRMCRQRWCSCCWRRRRTVSR